MDKVKIVKKPVISDKDLRECFKNVTKCNVTGKCSYAFKRG